MTETARQALAASPDTVVYLEWDSAFFGFPVAQVDRFRVTADVMAEAVRWCARAGIRLLQFKCDAHSRESILAAESHGFHFADARLSFTRTLDDLDERPLDAGSFEVRRATVADEETLTGIASGLFETSRYYFDDNFDRDRVRVFYADWLRKSLRGAFDDYVLCACRAGAPVSFCTVRHIGDDSMRIGLIGAAVGEKGTGAGRAVLGSALTAMKADGGRRVDVVTQGRNYSAQRLYQRAGFVTDNLEIYYHKWF